MVLDNIAFVDDRIKNVAEEAVKYCSKEHYESFARKYLANKTIQELDWIDVCTAATSHKKTDNGWRAACALTIYCALGLNLYSGRHKDALTKLYPHLSFLTNKDFHRYDRVLCGANIDYMMVVDYKYGNRQYSFPFYYGTNGYIRQLLSDILNDKHRSFWRTFSNDIIADFERSLGDYASTISDISDFSERTLLAQTNYFMEKYEGDDNKKSDCVAAIIYFYRYLCYSYPEANLFGKTSVISQVLLESHAMRRMILQKFQFFRINPFDDFGDYTRYCFILSGPYCRSTRTMEDGYAIVDISAIKTAIYRRVLIQYLQNRQHPIGGIPLYITRALSLLEDMKSVPGYSNNNLLHINILEANALLSYFSKSEEGDVQSIDDLGPSVSLHITYVRGFFTWCQEAEKFTFEDQFFKIFKPVVYQYYRGGDPAGKDEISLLGTRLEQKGKDSLKHHLIYLVFTILLQTEMRINHILSAKTTSFKETFKKNQYALVGITKTSHGEEEETHLAPQTKDVFSRAIKATEAVRKACKNESIKDFVFIYPRSKTRTVRLSLPIFTQGIKTACADLGIKNITAKILRDTHATAADAFLRKTNKPSTQLTQLTGHSSNQVTEQHYLQYNLADMLEAAYGVSFTAAYEELEEHVKDDNTIGANRSNIVQEGCGICNTSTCSNSGIPLCLVCKHFITTTNHLPFFKKAIEDIDNRIEAAQNKHDVEDLVSLKEIYVKYLAVIYSIIEHNASDTVSF